MEGNEESRVGSLVRGKVVVTVEPKAAVVVLKAVAAVELRVAVVTAAGLRVEVVVTRAAEVASVEGDEGSRAGSSVRVKVAVTVTVVARCPSDSRTHCLCVVLLESRRASTTRHRTRVCVVPAGDSTAASASLSYNGQ